MSACAELLARPMRNRNSRCSPSTVAWVVGPPLTGMLFGLFLPIYRSPHESLFNARLSIVIGWGYFFAWSVSFYPQVFQNFRRRSVTGLSFDYQLLNLAGFSCYFAFNAAMYWDPKVRREYQDAHDGHTSAVKLNDVVFAGHAMLITLVTILQIAVYWDYPPLGGAERVTRTCVIAFLSALAVGSALLAFTVVVTSEKMIQWLSFFGFLSEVKVAISLVKYIPQVWMNYRRKSTTGWSIENVLLDFTGGAMSVAQLLLDGWATSDWSQVSGDPAKFLLGNVSIVFDIVFILQHYFLYRPVSFLTED